MGGMFDLHRPSKDKVTVAFVPLDGDPPGEQWRVWKQTLGYFQGLCESVKAPAGYGFALRLQLLDNTYAQLYEERDDWTDIAGVIVHLTSDAAEMQERLDKYHGICHRMKEFKNSRLERTGYFLFVVGEPDLQEAAWDQAGRFYTATALYFDKKKMPVHYLPAAVPASLKSTLAAIADVAAQRFANS